MTPDSKLVSLVKGIWWLFFIGTVFLALTLMPLWVVVLLFAPWFLISRILVAAVLVYLLKGQVYQVEEIHLTGYSASGPTNKGPVFGSLNGQELCEWVDMTNPDTGEVQRFKYLMTMDNNMAKMAQFCQENQDKHYAFVNGVVYEKE